MNFDFKEMYRYLLSHTLPGLIFGIEVILTLYWFSDLPVKSVIKAWFTLHPSIIILIGYAVSTLLGFIVDGIHHFVFEDLLEIRIIIYIKHLWNKSRLRKYARWFYPLQFTSKESEKKFKAFCNENKMEIYSHYIEEDYYYPYETYANISIVVGLGVLLLLCLLSYGKSCGVEIKPLTTILLKITIPVFTIITIVMAYEAKTTLEACEDEEDQFSSAFAPESEDVLSANFTVFNPEILENVLTIEKESFPPEWQYDDAREYYKDMLSIADNINIILKSGEIIVGYLLAMPHYAAFEELKDDDSKMNKNVNSFYIETAAIITGFRGKDGLALMLDKLQELCENRDVYKWTMHARVVTGLSKKMQNNYVVTKIRRIEKWKYYNHQEPTDYLEVVF